MLVSGGAKAAAHNKLSLCATGGAAPRPRNRVPTCARRLFWRLCGVGGGLQNVVGGVGVGVGGWGVGNIYLFSYYFRHYEKSTKVNQILLYWIAVKNCFLKS